MNPPEFCLLEVNWWPLCMAKSEWASWAQAVFSVAAIAAAIWIGHRTDAKAKQGARNHLAVFKSSAKSAIRYVMNAAVQKDYSNYPLGCAMVRDAIHLGQTVPLHLLAGHDAFTAMRYRAVISTAGAAVEPDPNVPEWANVEFPLRAQVLGELLEDLKRVDEHKGGAVVEDWS